MKKTFIFILPFLFLLATLPAKRNIHLNNIRYYTYPDYTRVVLDLSSSLQIKEKILPGQNLSRLYFDLSDCDFSALYPEEKRKEIFLKSGNLKKIRLGKRDQNTVRIVFDFDKIGKYDKFYLTSPFRIVFDIFQDDQNELAADRRTESDSITPPPKLSEEDQYSVVRQLGLGVHKIMIDPGHGGKDPGTYNRMLNLFEKNITLDIAKILKSILSKNTSYEVYLTREDDRYISLEERTAIANSEKSDLFISIHVNSAPRKNTRGVETFFLSFSSDSWSMSVAAQENAISQKSIGEMKLIVEQIVKNAKISESKILSQCIQSHVVQQLQNQYNEIGDLGVKKAPFYVLVGATMPATLVEISFLSNTQEALRLKTSAYRNFIANGLYYGIISYIKSLGKN